MASIPSPTGRGDLSVPPPQPPVSQPPSESGPPLSAVAEPLSGLSNIAFPQEVMRTVMAVKDSLTHLVSLLPPLAPFVAQSLDQLLQMTQAVVQQSSSGPPEMGGGAQPMGMMMPGPGTGAPPPAM